MDEAEGRNDARFYILMPYSMDDIQNRPGAGYDSFIGTKGQVENELARLHVEYGPEYTMNNVRVYSLLKLDHVGVTCSTPKYRIE